MNKQVKFKDWICDVVIDSYAVNRKIKAILLTDVEDGSPIATATAYHNDLKNDEIAIKDYSENEGIYRVLLNANIISKAHRTIKSGYIELLVCRLLE